VPLLVGVKLFAYLNAEGLWARKGRTHLHGLLDPAQVLILDPSVQRLSSVLARIIHEAQLR
jgi:hypothetical protein